MTRLLTALLVAAVLAGSAAAVGPWPGLAQSVTGPSGISYQAVARAGFTTVTALRSGGAVVASTRIPGAYGIPAVTTVGEAGGLSPSGKLLVLAPPPNYRRLRTQSRFVLLSAPSLTGARTIVLRGEFGFDAISPNGRWLYVLQRKIADKGEPAETMRGMPIARATSARGDWVYTLYTRDPETQTMFVHALNAAGRYAHCIDLPVAHTQSGDLFSTTLKLNGRTLLVRDVDGNTLARIDTRTLTVS